MLYLDDTCLHVLCHVSQQTVEQCVSYQTVSQLSANHRGAAHMTRQLLPRLK